MSKTTLDHLYGLGLTLNTAAALLITVKAYQVFIFIRKFEYTNKISTSI